MYAFDEQNTFPKVVINTLVYVREKKKANSGREFNQCQSYIANKCSRIWNLTVCFLNRQYIEQKSWILMDFKWQQQPFFVYFVKAYWTPTTGPKRNPPTPITLTSLWEGHVMVTTVSNYPIHKCEKNGSPRDIIFPGLYCEPLAGHGDF